jgi:hypothetical protein
VSEAEQVAQVAPASVVPQLEQKRPEAGAPHEGQRDELVPSAVGARGVAGGVVIASKLHRGDTPWQRRRDAQDVPRRTTNADVQVWWLPPG